MKMRLGVYSLREEKLGKDIRYDSRRLIPFNKYLSNLQHYSSVNYFIDKQLIEDKEALQYVSRKLIMRAKGRLYSLRC